MTYTKVNKLSKECKDNIMNSIKQEKMLKAPIPWKWKTASIAALLALVLLIPINGKTALATVKDWIEIIINKNTVTITIDSHDKPNIVYDDVDSNISEVIKTIEDAKAFEISNSKYFLPSYIPYNMTFSKCDYHYYSAHGVPPISSYSLLYTNDAENASLDCWVAYQPNTIERTSYTSSNVKLKAITLGKSKGYFTFIKDGGEHGDYFGLNVFHNSPDVEIQLSYSTNTKETYEKNSIENELIKMAQSLLDKIDSSLK